jgi:hypothetical protein
LTTLCAQLRSTEGDDARLGLSQTCSDCLSVRVHFELFLQNRVGYVHMDIYKWNVITMRITNL